MKKKNGFTLIELLAVIVILAIIALIATPIVLGLISRARKGAATDAAYGVRKEAQLLYSTTLMEHPTAFNKITVTFKSDQSDPVIAYDGGTDARGNAQVASDLKFELDGTKPSSGTITINGNGKIEYKDIVINNYYCCIPEQGEITCSDKSIENCSGNSGTSTPGDGPDNTPTGEQPAPGIDALTISKLSENELEGFIGKYVTNLTTKNGYNKWRIFYADGNNIALIAENYVALNSFGNDTFEDEYISCTELANDICAFNYAEDITDKFSDEEAMSAYKDEAGKVAIARIPTLEDFAKSYNSVTHNDNYRQKIYMKYYPADEERGYYEGYCWSESIDDINNQICISVDYNFDDTEYEHLWFIEPNMEDVSGYWLNTRAFSQSSDELFYIDSTPEHVVLGSEYAYNPIYAGLRPIVLLNSNVTLTKHISDTNVITYTIN